MAHLARLIVTLSALLVVAGCTGSEGRDDLSQTAAFAARGNAICTKYGRAVETYERAAPTGPKVATKLHTVVEAAREETNGLRELIPPADIKETFVELLERHEMRDKLLSKLTMFAKHHPQVVTARTNPQWEENDRDIVTLAARAGLGACAATSLDLTSE